MSDFGNERPLVVAIDDDREVLNEIAAVLTSASFACCCCTTPEEAMAAVQTTPPDLILCDVNLQGESGLELCERIAQLPGLHEVPVMFLSGAQLPDIIRRSYFGGGIYCLRKPFAPDVLVELIDRVVGVPEA